MDAPLDVGDRLREARERQGLSQRALARRAGVTNATISMIERGQISPSVASLRKLLEALGLSLGAFFADEPNGADIFFARHDLLELGRGGLSLRQVGHDLRGRTLQMLHETYGGGADTGESMLTHEGEEAGIVIRGEIEVTVGDARRVLGPGDAYYFESRTPHRFRNLSAEPCEIISACTPPTF